MSFVIGKNTFLELPERVKIDYFGLELSVSQDAKYIATSIMGFVREFNFKPYYAKSTGCWHDTRSNGRLIGQAVYIGEAEDSLMKIQK